MNFPTEQGTPLIYLRSVRLDKEELPAGFPFDIPCIRTLESLDFTHPLTFFVGENGCGKSLLKQYLRMRP